MLEYQQSYSALRCMCTFVHQHFSTPPWNDAVLITPHNSIQSKWNTRATEKHCSLTGEILYICPAEDSTHNMPLSNMQRLNVAKLPLKQTEQLPMIIQICKGMCIMVTHNIATSANLSNSSHRRITDIILDPREPKTDLRGTAERKMFLLYPSALIIIHLDFCEILPLLLQYACLLFIFSCPYPLYYITTACYHQTSPSSPIPYLSVFLMTRSTMPFLWTTPPRTPYSPLHPMP